MYTISQRNCIHAALQYSPVFETCARTEVGNLFVGRPTFRNTVQLGWLDLA